MSEYKFEDIALNSTKKKIPELGEEKTYIGLEHLDTGCLFVNRFGSDVSLKGDKLIMQKGDILFGRRNTYLKRAAIAPHDGIFSAHGMVLRPKESVINKDFFPHFILSDYFMDEAIKISVGSLSPTVNWKDLKELKFNLPSLSEQKKLAETLWSIVSTMESYKKLLAKTDEMVKAKFVEMFGNPLLNPKQLKTDSLKNLSKNLDSKRIPITSGDRKKGIYPYYGASGIVDYVDDFIFDGDFLLISEDGANLKERVTPIAFSITGKNWVNNHAHILQFEEKEFQRFVEYLINMIDISSYITGTAQPKLNQDKLNSIPILVPSKEKINEFYLCLEKAYTSKSAIQASLNSLTHVYKKIIAKNLGGK